MQLQEPKQIGNQKVTVQVMLLRLFQVLGIGSKLALGSLSVPASGSREKNLHLCGSWGANMKADLVYCPWKEAEMQRIQKCTHSAS